jgi:hypothetical protein
MKNGYGSCVLRIDDFARSTGSFQVNSCWTDIANKKKLKGEA